MRKNSPGSRLLILTTLSFVCALPLAGCGEDDGIGQRFPVSGTVKYNGEPLKKGTVSFFPEDPATGRGATGSIQEDGSYTLTTQSPGDGAFGGKYKVAISSYDVDDSTIKPPLGGLPDQVDVAHAKRTNLIPIKYSNGDTSGLTATVGPGSNTFNFDLEGTMTEADQAPVVGTPKKKGRPKR